LPANSFAVNLAVFASHQKGGDIREWPIRLQRLI
jgi:hypothetical protein